MPSLHSLRSTSGAVAVLVMSALTTPPSLAAQDSTRASVLPPPTFHACYDPSVGAMYLIRLPGLPSECLRATHVAIRLRGAATEEGEVGAETVPSGTAGGDLGGTYPNPVVDGLQGRPVSAAVPAANEFLRWHAGSGSWRPAAFNFSGDVTGAFNAATVARLQGRAVATTAPTAGQVLQWNATTSAWTPATASGGGGVTVHSGLTGLQADDHPQYLLTSGARTTTGFAVTAGGTPAFPASGPGSRILFYNGAFRAGQVLGTEWDQANVGVNSMALGTALTATGPYTTALGRSTNAIGNTATAMGFGTVAQGDYSTAMGFQGNATGQYSTAMGQSNLASGFNSTALGGVTIASGGFSTAMGLDTEASGGSSTAMGSESVASGGFSTAMGYNTRASGSISTAMGDQSNASGIHSTAMGTGTVASGSSSTAMGKSTTASALASTAMGYLTTASGDYSTAMGQGASTNGHAGSFVYGDNTGTAILLATAANQFSVRASGGIRLRTRSDIGTGCNLAAGGGTWNCTSSKALKHDFGDIPGEDLLGRLRELPVRTWRYIGEEGASLHMGPFAEDFHATFGLGPDNVTIGHLDLSGVALGAAKALEVRTTELRAALDAKTAELSATRSEVAALRDLLAEMARRLERLEQREEGRVRD